MGADSGPSQTNELPRCNAFWTQRQLKVDPHPHLVFVHPLSDSQNEGLDGMRKYEDVQALLICWKSATSTFLEQRKGLEGVLKSPYRFGTTPFNIPLEDDPLDSLTDEIRKFKKTHNKEQNLLIVYYGGHGIIGEKGDLILKWLAKHNPSLPRSTPADN